VSSFFAVVERDPFRQLDDQLARFQVAYEGKGLNESKCLWYFEKFQTGLY
jgi:hypothetical protein